MNVNQFDARLSIDICHRFPNGLAAQSSLRSRRSAKERAANV